MAEKEEPADASLAPADESAEVTGSATEADEERGPEQPAEDTPGAASGRRSRLGRAGFAFVPEPRPNDGDEMKAAPETEQANAANDAPSPSEEAVSTEKTPSNAGEEQVATAADESGPEQPSLEQPSLEQPVPEQPAPEQPVAEQASPEVPEDTKPAADQGPAVGKVASVSSTMPVEPIDERRRIWRPRTRKYAEETDGDPSWYTHRRHVLIFTYSGKPVYTRYGSEEGLVSTTGALSAIVSKMQAFFFAGGGSGDQDSLRYMVAGDHIFVFIERGPLWLVCISKHGDTYQDCVRMLDRVHLQIITILTAGIERTLTSRPNYDMRSLLGGTDNVVNNMIRWSTQDLQVEGFEPLPLPPVHRTAAVDALRGARVQNVLCAFLLAAHRIIAIVANRQYKVHAADLQALVNLIMSSASLRNAESWTPVCLVHLSDKAFAYAYISYVDGADVGIVFLSTASDGDQFYEISKQAAKIKQSLQKSGCLDAATNAMDRCPIDFRAAAASDTGNKNDRSGKRSLLAYCPPAQWKLLENTIHAAYFVPSLQQYFSSAIAPHHQSRSRTKMLFRNYGRCRQLLRKAKQPCQICVATDHECFYVFLAAEFHLYLTVPRGTSTGVIGQLYQWFRSQESHILLGNIPTW